MISEQYTMNTNSDINNNFHMKIAILYICTGKYNQFFKGFYESCERYFLTGIAEKEYFVWTDDMTVSDASNVNLIYHECKGFPADSLFKFDMFLECKEQLKGFDYIYFFNSNAEFKSAIGKELLPDTNLKLVGAVWRKRKRLLNRPFFYPYERNKQSCAYIPPKEPEYHYYMGGLNGGAASEYLKMIETLAGNIRKDYNNGIVAIVHDESHINWYFHHHPCKILSDEYCCPEEWSSSFQPKIILRDKVKIDPYFNKGRDLSSFGRIKKAFELLYRAVLWYW